MSEHPGPAAPVAPDLQGKVALVTGGGKGVGAAISRELARRGAHVVVNYFHSPQAAEETVAVIRRAGGRAQALRASVAQHEQVTTMFAALAEEHGGVDILVNNAARGVFTRFDDLTDIEWQRALDTNLHGARWCALAAAPLMAARGGGAMVNVSSIGAGLAMDNYLLVGVCKAALEAMTRYLAADLGPQGIRVNTASAGVLEGPTAALFPDAADLHATCRAAAPLGRLGTEDDLARLVAFLASPQAGWISGQCLLADGGLSVGRAMLTPRSAQAPSTTDDPTDPAPPAPAPAPRAAPPPPESAAGAVAVVGMGLVAPGVEGPDMLWQRLAKGAPQFSEPEERFELEHFWSAEPAADRTYSRVAGYARPLPPGREDFLTAWTRTALTQCGARDLAARTGTRAACFAGAWNEGSQHVEESLLVETAVEGIAAHWPDTTDQDIADLRERLRTHLRGRYRHAGTLADHLPLAAIRTAVAQLLPVRTPVQVVDTACSSSLYAIDLGARALLDGECELALCGGAFSLGPRYSVLFSQLRGLSRRGAVRALDAEADGVLFSDGVGFVALKRLDRARADGDRILGVLAGFGAASDGRGRAAHAPNHTGQERALARARATSGIAPEQVDWVVAHATGTPVGDQVERGVVSRQLPHAWCTSNKSVIGHTGWTAGVASVVHALQGLAHGVIPPQIPYRAPDAAPALRVPTRATSWPRPADRPRTVGVSSFGFGGTNAHLLLQDAPRPGEPAPACLPEPVENDPVVAVAWSAHLPGTPGAADVARRLTEGRPPAAQRSFGPSYPLPSFTEVRMPSRTAAGIDRAQLMALQAVAKLTGPDGPWWDGLRERCGVFAAHTGIPTASPDITVRCYAASLTEAARSTAPPGLDPAALEQATAAFLAAVRERTNPGEDTLAGLMPNVIPARVAALHDLHGPTMTVDTGATSGRSALRAAAAHLRRGELDLALVIGVNGASGPAFTRLYGLEAPHLAEGAFALALTRASSAADQGWPVLAELATLLDVLPAEDSQRTGWSYLGTDDLVDILRHLTATAPPDSVPPDHRHVAGGTATAAVTRRHTLSWQLSGSYTPETRPLPARTLVITSPRHASALRPVVQGSPYSRLITLDSRKGPQEAVEAALAASPRGFGHLRVVADLHPCRAWPAPPSADVLAVQEAAFWAVRQLRDPLAAGGTCALAVMAPFTDGHPAPHAHLFTGFVKSLAWELTGCTTRAVVSDTARPRAALATLEDELARPADGLPVVHHYDGARLVQRLTANDPPLDDDALPLSPGAVVVATGGARGITAACLLGLARQVPLRVHLVGSSRPGDVPDDLLDTPEDALHAARARYISTERARRPDRPVREIIAAFDRLLHARESALTLRALRERCGADHVHFHTCDVTDPKAVRALADTIRVREGHVDLLVNGAGLHHPGDITRKTLPGMRRIRDVKLYGYHHLRAAFTGALAPRLWCNFGSVTGIVGLPGESDYSPANDFLSAAAHAGPPGEYTIAWTIWDETGLGSGAIVQSYTARTARLSRMATAEGVAHFLTELRRRPRCEDRLVTFVGGAEHRSFEALFPGLRASYDGAPDGTAPPSADVAREDETPPSTPQPPGITPPPADAGVPPGLLPRPAEHHDDRASWQLTLDLATHGFLRNHLVDGKPTMPGVMLADIAVQAARTLVPTLPVRGVDDLIFSAWVRARTDGQPAHFRVEARRTGTKTARSVHVTIRSDTTAPGGRILARDREHFRATVRLGGPPPVPGPHGSLVELHRAVDDPYYDSASPVQLTGAFRATDQCRAADGGAAARWHPGLQRLSGLPRLSTPATLLDSLARTRVLQPTPDGHHAVLVPRHIERITLYEPGDDHTLIDSHPDGLGLCHSSATGTSTAITSDGRVIAQITGMRGVVLAHLPGRISIPAAADRPVHATDTSAPA